MNAKQIRDDITQRIVEALEAGTVPWRRPWTVSPNAKGMPRNVVSKKPYSGVNPLLLALHSMHGFQSRWWGTFRQWDALGCAVQRRPGDVKPGRWGCQIVFYKPITKTVANAETGEEEEKRFGLLRTYTVFNADQVDGEAAEKFKVLADQEEEAAPVKPDFEPAEQLIVATGADIRYRGEKAFYLHAIPEGSWPNHKAGDFIQVPPKAKFDDVRDFYEVAFHELAHWSEPRTGSRPKEHAYAFCELVAEIACCFVSSEIGIPESRRLTNHAAYVQSWLNAMKSDSSFVFKASTQASKTTDFILSFAKQPETEPEPVEAHAR